MKARILYKVKGKVNRSLFKTYRKKKGNLRDVNANCNQGKGISRSS